MKQILYLSFFLISVLSSCSLQKTSKATNTKIFTGYVFSNDDKQPLGGANIKIKGSKTIKARTDWDGKFEIEIKEGDILIIEYLGFESKKIKIYKQNSFKIFLLSQNYTLKETH
jgi:major membrane immunogen (membrane-anchored lipoprotein)